MFRSSLFAAVIAAVGLCFAAGSASASLANDDFANATQIDGLSGKINGSTHGATMEPGEPQHFEPNPGFYLPKVNSSVWYRWTAPVSGLATLDVCDVPAPWNGVRVYTGSSVSGLIALDGNIDVCRWRKMVTAGATYRIAVVAPNPEYQISFELEYELLPTPTNDDFADAHVLTGTSDTDVTFNDTATRESGEPNHNSTDGEASLWYRWQAPISGRATVSVCESDFYTAIAVYKGSALGALTELGADFCEVTFDATAGETYRIAVDGKYSSRGKFSLKLRAYFIPANDDFADAQALSDTPLSVPGTTAGASAEPSEPEHGFYTERTVWYDWTPSETGLANVDVCAHGLKLEAAVYTGDSLDTLEKIDAGVCQLAFPVTADESYKIVIDGQWKGDFGKFVLKLRMIEPPPNDNFADAVVLTGSNVTGSGDNTGATSEPEYDGAGPNNSVWFKWTAPESGSYTFDTCGSQFDTVLGMSSGDGLTWIESNDNSQPGTPYFGTCGLRSKITRYAVEAGTTYSLRISGANRRMGAYQLRIYPGDFVPVKYSVSAVKSGDGEGSVTFQELTWPHPTKVIDCGALCSSQANDGTILYMSGEAAPGSVLTGWQVNGEEWAACWAKVCSLEMLGNTVVTANFEKTNAPPGKNSLTVNRKGSGNGTVTSSPAGIDCGTTCAADFDEGATVTLNPAPAKGSSFKGWSGACTGTGPCEVTLDQDAAVTAEFARKASRNGFTLKTGKPRFNRRTGTATVPVTVSGAARITLAGKGTRTGKASTKGKQTVKLNVVATGKLKKRLKKMGKVTVKVTVAAKPATGKALTKKLTVRLKTRKG